jgi:hypothetical protein
VDPAAVVNRLLSGLPFDHIVVILENDTEY